MRSHEETTALIPPEVDAKLQALVRILAKEAARDHASQSIPQRNKAKH